MKRKSKMLLLIACSFILCLAGCQKDDGKERIYYKEEGVEVPLEVTRIHDLREKKDGTLMMLADTEEQNTVLHKQDSEYYLFKPIGKECKELKDRLMVEEKILTDDKCYAAAFYFSENEKTEMEYFIVNKDGSSKELSLDLSVGNQLTEDNMFHCMVTYKNTLIGVDNAGIIYSFSEDGKPIYVNEKIAKETSNIAGMVGIKDKIYVIPYEKDVYCISAKTGEKQDGDKKLAQFLKAGHGEYITYFDQKNQLIYKLNDEMIELYDLKKEKEEKLLEFKHYNLRNGKNFKLIAGRDKTMYISYTVNDTIIHLKKYVYHPEGIKVEEDPLIVYSLYEDLRVEKNIEDFKLRYPDIPIAVEIGSSLENGKTADDAIKLLNTELMSGKGPDIIMLDGLPYEEYFEKGILVDLNDVIDKKKIKGKFFDNMLQAYTLEQKQYAIPMRFQVYGIIGKKDIVDNFEDTDKLLSLVESKNLNYAIHDWNLSEAANIIYLKDIPECFEEGGKIDKGKLSHLYENLKRLYHLAGNSFNEECELVPLFGSPEKKVIDGEVEYIYYDKLPFVMGLYAHDESFLAENYLVKKKGYKKAYLKEDGNLVFEGWTILGASKNSKKKDEIKKFFDVALNEGQEFTGGYSGGLRVKKEPLKSAFMNKNRQGEFVLSSFGYGENPEMIEIKALGLTEKEYNKLERQFETAVKAKYTSYPLRDLIMEGARDYCKDNKTLEQAVNDTVQKVEIYNAE